MFKNVTNPVSLLIVVLVIGLASCSPSRNYSKRSYKKSRVERNTRSTEYVRAKTRKSKSLKNSNSSKRSQIVSTAKKYIGRSYTYGGKKPSTGFDCSGFTSHVFKNNGIDLNGASHNQAKQGRMKEMRELEKGDLVFFGNNNRVSHVGIVADVNRDRLKVIHSTSSRGVVIDEISSSDYWKSRYLFGRDVLN